MQEITTICDCEYPVSFEEVEASCTDVYMELPTGSQVQMTELLDTLQDPPEEFRSSTELFNTLMSVVPDGGIGRKYYDDRGQNSINGRDQQSI